MEQWCVSTIILLVISGYSYSSPIYVKKNGSDEQNCWKLGESYPCSSLDFALRGGQLSHDVQIRIAPGSYKLQTSASTFTGKSSFYLMGEKRDTVKVMCSYAAGLSFINSSNIQIHNITFLSCGMEHISSSNNVQLSNDFQTKYLNFTTGLFFLFCTNVSLKQVEISNSVGIGLTLYSTGGMNYITQCTFNNNTAYHSAGGGGVAIEFLFCKPGDSDCLENHPSVIKSKFQQNAHYVFEGCIFFNNNGSINNFTNNSLIAPHANQNIALGRGGGLSILFKGNSSGNQIILCNCTFNGNTAVWGGGILIEFQDRAKGNTIDLREIIFQHNTCNYDPCTYRGTGGGGARIQFAGIGKNVSNNTVRVYNTIFSGNSAYFGGGVSFFTYPEQNQSAPANFLYFNNTAWSSNIARLGSAIDLSLWSLTTGGVVVNPVFEECNFTNNTADYSSAFGVPQGIGTVYTKSIPIVFKKSVQFIANEGSALVSLDAAVEFDNIGIFYNNKGRVGAAITLYSQGFILMKKNSFLSLENNTAALYGGGIYWESIGDHQLVSSTNCFIRYEDMFAYPKDWEVSFNFSNNRAGISGNSIYATTLQNCLWGGNPYGKRDSHQESDVFCWSKTWNYNGEDCNESIATAPAYFYDDNNTLKCDTVGYSVSRVPGELSNLPIYMVDDKENQIPNKSLFFFTGLNVSNATYTYISREAAVFYGDIGDVLDVHIDTVGSRAIASRVLVSLAHCPPGFQIDSTNKACISANYPYIHTSDNMNASIQLGYWIGFIDKNKTKLGVGLCFYCTFNEELAKSTVLPKTNDELNDFFCKKLNRKGVLCGACRDGYGPAVNSHQYKCIRCSSDNRKYSWIQYILTEYIPITIILVIVIIFNISITSGPANAFVFFAQVISAAFGAGKNGVHYSTIVNHEGILEDIYLSLYGVWNLVFLNDITNDKWLYSLGPSLTQLHIEALHYFSAVYPLLLILIASVILYLYDRDTKFIVCIFRPLHFISARLLRQLNFKNSIMDTFATFIILSYVKFLITSVLILYPVPIYGNESYLAVYKYGDIHYSSWQFAPYLLTAAFVLGLCVLGPLILILYSIKPYYSFLERYNLKFLLPGEKLHYFLTSFHHCYKDGSKNEHDRRYFAGIYFLLRLVLISSFAYSSSWPVQYVWQQIICTIGLFLFGVFQPYKKNWYNALDAFMFGLLSIINIFSFYNSYLSAANLNLSPFVYWFQLILIYLPLLYISAYIIVYAITSNRKVLRKLIVKAKGERDLDDFGAYIDDITAERLHQHNRYHGPVTIDDIQHESNVDEQLQEPCRTEPILPSRKAELQYGSVNN